MSNSNGMKKNEMIIIIVILFLAAGVYLFARNRAIAPTDSYKADQNVQDSTTGQNPASSAPSTQTNVKGNTGADYTPPQSSNAGEVAPPNIQVTEVDFDGSKFTPNPVNIKVGDYIFFKNKGTDAFWPLGGSANTMAAYPNFTAGKPIAPGAEYKFQFTKAGSFSYGDNLHANAAATINVTQ